MRNAGVELVVLIVTAAFPVGCAEKQRTVLSVPAPRGDHVAYVTEDASGGARAQTLWLVRQGKQRRIDRIDGAGHRCSRIVWSPGAFAAVFLIEGTEPLAGVIALGGMDGTFRPVTAHINFAGFRRLDAIAVDDQFGRVTVPLDDGPPANPLWAPPGGSARLAVYEGGESDITLEIDASRSKESTTDALRHHFSAAGWQEQPFEWMNPQTPTSFASGWRRGDGGLIPTDAEGRPLPPSQSPRVHLWTGEWKNRQGDLVRYNLASVNGGVRGNAGHYPRKVVDEVRARFHTR